jgi:hypothetical protein
MADKDLDTLLERMARTRVNRRGFLAGPGMAGLGAFIAACTPGSTAGPSTAPSTAPAPSSSVSVSEPTAPQPSTSAAAGSGDAEAWRALRDDQLRPALNEVSAALTAWGQAFNAAGASGASAADKSAYKDATTRLKDALSAAKTAASTDVPACAQDAVTQARAFVELLDSSLTPIITEETISLSDLAAVGATLDTVVAQATQLKSAIDSACP